MGEEGAEPRWDQPIGGGGAGWGLRPQGERCCGARGENGGRKAPRRPWRRGALWGRRGVAGRPRAWCLPSATARSTRATGRRPRLKTIKNREPGLTKPTLGPSVSPHKHLAHGTLGTSILHHNKKTLHIFFPFFPLFNKIQLRQRYEVAPSQQPPQGELALACPHPKRLALPAEIAAARASVHTVKPWVNFNNDRCLSQRYITCCSCAAHCKAASPPVPFERLERVSSASRCRCCATAGATI